MLVLPDALVLTSPLCFSMELCLSVTCLPGFRLLLKLELLPCRWEATVQLKDDVRRGLSEPARTHRHKTQKMNASIADAKINMGNISNT